MTSLAPEELDVPAIISELSYPIQFGSAVEIGEFNVVIPVEKNAGLPKATM
ncbi:hypothetical protein MY1884_001525 [Beauveria asiatica]